MQPIFNDAGFAHRLFGPGITLEHSGGKFDETVVALFDSGAGYITQVNRSDSKIVRVYTSENNDPFFKFVSNLIFRLNIDAHHWTDDACGPIIRFHPLIQRMTKGTSTIQACDYVDFDGDQYQVIKTFLGNMALLCKNKDLVITNVQNLTSYGGSDKYRMTWAKVEDEWYGERKHGFNLIIPGFPSFKLWSFSKYCRKCLARTKTKTICGVVICRKCWPAHYFTCSACRPTCTACGNLYTKLCRDTRCPLNTCAFCGKRCRNICKCSVAYCDETCQQMHWPLHKSLCGL